MSGVKKELSNLEKGDIIKVVKVKENKLSELKKNDLVGLFKIVDVKKPTISRIFGKKKEVKAIKKNSTKFKFIFTRRGVVLYSKSPNGVNYHGVVEDIKKLT